MSAEPAHRLAIAAPALPRPAPLNASLQPEILASLDSMRQFLAARQPASGNEALKLLRAAFPDSPLDMRVKAAADRGPAF